MITEKKRCMNERWKTESNGWGGGGSMKGTWRGRQKENKLCQVNVNGDRDLVLLNIDGAGMGN